MNMGQLSRIVFVSDVSSSYLHVFSLDFSQGKGEYSILGTVYESRTGIMSYCEGALFMRWSTVQSTFSSHPVRVATEYPPGILKGTTCSIHRGRELYETYLACLRNLDVQLICVVSRGWNKPKISRATWAPSIQKLRALNVFPGPDLDFSNLVHMRYWNGPTFSIQRPLRSLVL